MTDADLYDSDILLWSERQAELLRQAADGVRVNAEAPDWPNIIEEIESVGRSELHAVQSLLVQALLHDLKIAAWPQSRDVPHWRAEARGFRRQAKRQFTPSMRQRIDLADLYADALDRLPDSMDGQPPLPVPATCPHTLDEILTVGTPLAGR
jgi:hypothetical protein